MNIDDESVTTLEDLRGDLANRYKRTPSSGSSVDSAIVDADLAALDRDGYLIWENLLSTEQCRQIRDIVRPWLGHTGRNSFEGRRTQRIYSVLSRTRACDRLVDHPRVLAVLDRLLMPNYLLSALQAINIQPGEAAQLAHHDDGWPTRSGVARGDARRLVRLLRGHALAWRGRQQHHRRAPCRHRPILPTVAATDGGLHLVGVARNRSNALR
jgi:hypothetical protein